MIELTVAADNLGYLGDSVGWSVIYFLAGYAVCKAEVHFRRRHDDHHPRGGNR